MGEIAAKCPKRALKLFEMFKFQKTSNQLYKTRFGYWLTEIVNSVLLYLRLHVICRGPSRWAFRSQFLKETTEDNEELVWGLYSLKSQYP